MRTTIESVQTGGPLHLPDGAGWYLRLRVGIRALRILTKDPDDCFAAPVFHLSMDRETWERIAEKLRRTPGGLSLLNERPSLQADSLDLPALRALPDGTLGNRLARYYEDNGIKPFESPYPVSSDVEYLATRYREIHDAVHIVTGYEPDEIGELELQAFILGNLGLRQSILAIVGTALFPPHLFPPLRTYARRLVTAYRRGRSSGDVAIEPRYERLWGCTLDDIRKQLAIAPLEPNAVQP